MSISLGELAVLFGCELRGDPDTLIDHVAPLSAAGPGALSFLANPRLAPQLSSTRASAVVLDRRQLDICPVAALVASNPHALFARIAAVIYPLPAVRPGVHPSAVIDAGAQIDASAEVGANTVIAAGAVIGARCFIGPACVIEAGVNIGVDSRLVARVTLLHGVQVGARALILPGAVIGADGFGFAREADRWLRVPQIGTVRIGDDVEIGANTTIDRGAINDTIIADGVKLDNLIQIAHNAQIGAHTAIAACTGVSGSTRIGARCMIGGGVGFAGHIDICDDVVITGMAMVTHSLREPGVYSSGLPVQPARRWRHMVARLRRFADSDNRGADKGAARTTSPAKPDETQQDHDDE